MTKPVAVVPLDGSATAEGVLPYAKLASKALGLELLLAKLDHEAWPGGDARAEAALQSSRHYLEGVAAALEKDGAGARTRAQPVGSDVAAGILGLAEDEDASLIMLATHGLTGPRRWMVGSVADAVVRSATRPVLVVTIKSDEPAAAAPEIRRILVPIDGSPSSDAALEQAAPLARQLSAVIDLVQVAPWSWAVYGGGPTEGYFPPDLDEKIEQGAKEYVSSVQSRVPAGLSSEAHVLRGTPADSIIDYAAQSHADLIVMGARGRSGVTRAVLGSVSDRVVRHGHLPVLLVHAPPES